MKLFLATTAVTLALAAPSFADTSPAELFAMSKTIVRETSMGDTTAARVRLALGNMSAAERQTFFDSDTVTRQRILKNIQLFGDSNSAAEMSAEIEASAGN